MIFQTITSLTYVALLNTESLSLSEKQHGPLFKDNDLESVGWAAAPQPQAHPSQESTITFCQQLPHDASCCRAVPTTVPE